MLLEQAFYALPEILCGSRYPGQEYEAGVVAAFTMAVLQELNGRNAPNPLSSISGERLFDQNGFGTKRYLRADMVVNTQNLFVASKRLGGHYGWRHCNWLEAKFFRRRSNEKTTNKTQPTAKLLADLIRLAVLVPEQIPKATENGRYLLHVYDREPADYISRRRNKNTNGSGGTRIWAKLIHSAGAQRLVIEELDKEPSSFQKESGSLGCLELTLDVTTQVIEPRVDPNSPAIEKLYWCYLTRIDTVHARLAARSFSIAADRSVSQGADGDFAHIRSQVATLLGQVEEAETEKPEDLSSDVEPIARE